MKENKKEIPLAEKVRISLQELAQRYKDLEYEDPQYLDLQLTF